MIASTAEGMHPHDYAARWTSAVEPAWKVQRQRDEPDD
jgi:hypothetical protein